MLVVARLVAQAGEKETASPMQALVSKGTQAAIQRECGYPDDGYRRGMRMVLSGKEKSDLSDLDGLPVA